MTTPMPTPNIPDEVVEAAVEAMRSDEFRVFGEHKTPNNGARKEAMRAALQAALPLMLEQVAWIRAAMIETETGDVDYLVRLGSTQEYADDEPLYRLKVSK